MTVGEVLAVAHSLPFRPVRDASRIGRLSLSRRIPTMRAWRAGA